MGYKLAASNGDTLAVPQLVLTHLTLTDGDTIRAALYILQTHDTDPRTMLVAVEMADRVLGLSYRGGDFDERILAIGRRALIAFGRDLSGDLSGDLAGNSPRSPR